MRNTLRQQTHQLIESLMAQGYAYTDVPILLPADQIADMPGEHVRGYRLAVDDGRCLRNDLTIPLGLKYLTDQSANKVCVAGVVFGAEREIMQVGFEHFAEQAPNTADALCVQTAYNLLPSHAAVQITFNDDIVLRGLLSALPLSAERVDRLCTAVRSRAGIEPLLQRYSTYTTDDEVSHALRPLNTRRLAGQRTPEAIEQRLHAKQQEQHEAVLSEDLGNLIRGIFDVCLPASQAADYFYHYLRKSLICHEPTLQQACDRLQQHATQMRLTHTQPESIFNSALGRGIAYYTGLVFEMRDTSTRHLLAAGGRYDGLLRKNKQPIAAVGAALFPQVWSVG